MCNLLLWDPIVTGSRLAAALSTRGGAGRASSGGGGGGGRGSGIRCPGCDAVARRSISRTPRNPGRPFWSCPTKQTLNQACTKFFKWGAEGDSGGDDGGGGQVRLHRVVTTHHSLRV